MVNFGRSNRVLVLGASGLLGYTVFRVLSEVNNWIVFGSLRTKEYTNLFPSDLVSQLFVGVDVLNQESLIKVFDKIRPDVVINCVSLAKTLLKIGNPLDFIPIYALLPHQLAKLCEDARARLIHISTDGVFSGSKGQYTEDDIPDAVDIYGRSKLLGELYQAHTITLRTSIIGHELASANGLLEWFLSQNGSCRCFTQSIFSGLPTVVLAQIIRYFIIPKVELSGLYHVAAKPISKFELLRQVADIYGKTIDLIPVDSPVLDRSLNSDRFGIATGYKTPDWQTLIRAMHAYQ